MDDPKARFRRMFWGLAGGQLLIFVLLGGSFWLLVRTVPVHEKRAAVSGSQEGETGGGGAAEGAEGAEGGSFLEEEAAVMFGAATIASTLTTALLAIVAIFSWVGIKEVVQQKVYESMDEYQKVDMAKMMTRVGTLYGQLSQPGDRSEEYLDNAVYYLRKAHEILAGREKEDLPTLNNFAFYLALQGKESSRAEALKLAARFRERNLLSRAGPGEYPEYLTTYGLLIAKYTRSAQDTRPEELEHVIRLTEELLTSATYRLKADRNLPLLRAALTRAHHRPTETSWEHLKRWAGSLFGRS